MAKNKQIYIIGLASVIIFPLIWIVMFSFFRSWSYPEIIGEFELLKWADLVNKDNEILSGLLLSLLISLFTAFFSVIAGFKTSESLYRVKSKNKLVVLAYLPYVLSPVVLALIIQVYFVRLGLSGTIAGVIVALILIVYPYSVLFFTGYWNERLIGMKDLARTLGGSNLSSWIKVVVPISKPMISLCFFQCFIIAWFEYGLTNLLGVGKVKTLPVQIFMYVQEANPYYAAVASCLMIIPPIILLLINKRWLSASIKYSPLK
ncbi:ABC transporter permease [Marinigracilibium pacificum]|uniref:ABC transporter permease subunit n=1 Tax=Marinigracilibium pacificum TaxID=2729599 RepID=A0A848IWH6_9BACT|nr:ABC transporter permease subunit [Marinigracilibium pacificum]NMM48873.1 ABC transporter permease subunit [Marinigracilibium pacificum]